MAKTNKVIPLSPSDVEEAKRNHLQILKETQEAGGGDKAFRRAWRKMQGIKEPSSPGK
jgi:hypothetical protein